MAESTEPSPTRRNEHQEDARLDRRLAVLPEALVLGTVCVVVFALLLAGALKERSPAERLDRVWLDAALSGRATAEVDTSDVAVILINDEALVQLGERWPLRRSTWATLLQTIHRYEPSAIAVDAWFEVDEPAAEAGLMLDLSDKLHLTGLADDGIGLRLADSLEEQAVGLDGDRQLSSALGNSGRVVLGLACTNQGTELAGVRPVDVDVEPKLTCPALSGNLPALAMAARGQAVLDVMRDSDGVLRRFPYIVGVRDDRYASLSLEAIRVGRPDDYEAALQRIQRLDRATPYQRAISPELFESVRLSDLMQAGPDHPGIREALQGRLVFIGVSANGTEDRIFTVLGAAIPGVYIHANAAVDALQARELVSGGAPSILSLGLGSLLLMLLVVLGRGITSAAGLGATVTVMCVGWAALAYAALDVGWVLPVSPMWMGMIGWGATRFAFGWFRIDQAKRRYQSQREVLLDDLTVANAGLAASLEDLRRARLAKARMESELAIGQEIQQAMLPTELDDPDDVHDVDINGRLLAAREVGGDLYDYFRTEDGRICVCVGDVSGKGVPAALFMAVSKTLVGALGRVDSSPASIVRKINDELARDNPNCMFLTLWLALLDPHTGQLTYCNAGHNPPYLRRLDGSWQRLTDRHGPVTGAMEDLEYEESTTQIAPGELLFLFTDGVVEAMNAANEFYEEDRLQAVLHSLGDVDSAAATSACFDDVLAFTGDVPRADDITVLTVRILPT
ncbi:MAG: serine phosphatase RsbU (regulator of sigma subunit)/CHASE2 domain-containing sensor protein [Kiritimatiellia bacterium]